MKRLFSLSLITCAACGLAGLNACKEEKEEPLLFETTAPTSYTFPETATSATFTVSGNTAWTVEVTKGRDRCSVTPASGKGDATVTVHITANPSYVQSNMTLSLVAGDYIKQIAVTQAAPPCPGFNPGAIAAAGQTITVGGAPATINSTQAATGGDGQITYQWYKNGVAIEGATAAGYTPPQSAATAAGGMTYTRRAKDNVCNTTFTPSTGSWVLNVVCPSFSSGAIATAGQTVTVGGTPVTINSTQNATSENGAISYQWYKNGNAISGATAASYTPPKSDATAVGTHTYTRRAKDNACNTTLTPSAGSWVLTVTCPFDAGAIATDGQTVLVDGTPVTISSVQNATGNGTISYQWYKNSNTISGATSANYTPPKSDATATGAMTYTRRAKDNTCNTTLTESAGSWVLNVICPFNPGAIAAAGQTVTVGGTPITIHSEQDATGVGAISYQWYKNGNAINGATEASYTPPKSAATAAGVHTYTRRAKDNVCNTTFTPSAGSWVLTVANLTATNCPLPQLPVTGAFADFPSNYSASTYVTLTDERDNKNYNVVKIGNRWIMAQNLNYQKDLTWQANSNQPTTTFGGQVTALIGHFWCPGRSGVTTSAKASCDVWGALYSWETAMSFDGKGAWTENATYNTGAANAAGSKFNHGRTSSGSGTGGRGICPPNWHVPTDHEWGIVLDGMESGGGTAHQNASNIGYYGTNAGSRGKSKCTCTSGDCSSDTDVSWYYSSSNQGTDVYGFRGLPAGYREYNGSSFTNRGNHAIFWSSSANGSSNAWRRDFNYTYATVRRYLNYRSNGFSVRCIRDL
ncbi:MAG: hypothetical protein LBF69_01470 [Prevotellaceae bacterium]|jgi:uncharacterized protein (TIGR02145 family)|nr:hypothetical protein [Prevotellaceae bacterium]